MYTNLSIVKSRHFRKCFHLILLCIIEYNNNYFMDILQIPPISKSARIDAYGERVGLARRSARDSFRMVTQI